MSAGNTTMSAHHMSAHHKVHMIKVQKYKNIRLTKHDQSTKEGYVFLAHNQSTKSTKIMKVKKIIKVQK